MEPRAKSAPRHRRPVVIDPHYSTEYFNRLRHIQKKREDETKAFTQDIIRSRANTPSSCSRVKRASSAPRTWDENGRLRLVNSKAELSDARCNNNNNINININIINNNSNNESTNSEIVILIDCQCIILMYVCNII